MSGEQTLAALNEPEPLPENFQERLSLFARLELTRRDLELRLDRVKRQVAAMNGPLLEEMVEQGMTNAKVHGLSIFIRKTLTVNKLSEKSHSVTTEMICSVLTSLGRDDMVSDGYSGASLKSLVKEMLDGGQEIPEALSKLLYVQQGTELGTLKS